MPFGLTGSYRTGYRRIRTSNARMEVGGRVEFSRFSLSIVRRSAPPSGGVGRERTGGGGSRSPELPTPLSSGPLVSTSNVPKDAMPSCIQTFHRRLVRRLMSSILHRKTQEDTLQRIGRGPVSEHSTPVHRYQSHRDHNVNNTWDMSLFHGLEVNVLGSVREAFPVPRAIVMVLSVLSINFTFLLQRSATHLLLLKLPREL